jgi:hypothetical protein
VNEILVTATGTPLLASVDELSGRRVFVRRASSYYDSLLALNKRLESSGKAPVLIEAAPPNLDDDDLLEMVNAELLPAVIVDDYVARFWKQVFPGIVLHDKVPVRSGGNLGIAIRKNSRTSRRPSTGSWASTGWVARSAIRWSADTAQGYQESLRDHSARSRVGAVGRGGPAKSSSGPTPKEPLQEVAGRVYLQVKMTVAPPIGSVERSRLRPWEAGSW